VNALEPPFGGLDPGGMAARIDGIPEQIEAALAAVAASPWRLPAGGAPALLAVGAMGGSAIAADLAAALYADRLPRPLLVVRDVRWPAWLSRDALALLCSYSGDTAETLALYDESGTRGARRAAITTGGTLAERCRRDGVPWFALPGGSPPRAALFSSFVPLTSLLHALGWIDDPAPAWREAAETVRALRGRVGAAVPERDNAAKRLARAVTGRLLYVYAGSGLMAPVATRLRQQLHENAKLLGHSAVVPELDHNEIVGWEKPGALHRGITVLLLPDPEDPPEVARRLELTGAYAARQGADVRPVEPARGGRLARMASAIAFADYLSLYLALAAGVDPTPIPSIDEFKRRLAASGA
jgi:glucose/mannose-6-phosphate isomerase